MDANHWLIVSIVGYSLAGVLLIAAAILFIKMNILAIIGDLTGKTAARQIQEIREQNIKTGDKRYRPSAFNMERGFLTEPMSSRLGRSGKIGKTAQVLAHKSKRLNPSGQMEKSDSKRLDFNRKMEETSSNHLNLSRIVGDAGPNRPDLKENMGGDPPSVVIDNLVEAKDSRTFYEDKETEVLFENKYNLSSNATVVLSDGSDLPHAEKESAEVVLLDATTVLSGEQDLTPATEVLTGADDISPSTEILPGEFDKAPETEVLSCEYVAATATEVLTLGQDLPLATEVLTEEADVSPPTEVLSNETVMLDRGTEVLAQDDETTVLYPTTELINEEPKLKMADFKIVKDIKVIHTNEVI